MRGLTIYLYDDGASLATANIPELANYLESVSGQEIILRRSPVSEALGVTSAPLRQKTLDRAAVKFASCRLRNPNIKESRSEPLPQEVDYERKRLAGGKATGLYYEGLEIQSYYAGLISREELGWNYIHIAIMNQLLASWDSDDGRYHARVIILGYPNLISVGGLIEGPAKPRGFYLERQLLSAVSPSTIAAEQAKQSIQGRYLEYGDSRITEVLKGPLVQALFYHIFGEVFCPDRGCRLFDARWQEDLIFAQIESGYEFCPRHTEMLQDFRSRRPGSAKKLRARHKKKLD